jgi:6-phosphogluconolactonase
MSEWREFASKEELDQALANHIAGRLQADIKDCGRASLAVSGGTTPTGMFQQLSRYSLDWAKVWLSLVDERQVAVDSADSNERLVREQLLQNHAAAAHFVSMAGGGDEDLAELQRRLAALPRPFTAVVLGMGSDGHTASWFPGAANLTALLDPDSTAEVAATEPPAAAHQRITLTLSAVLNSREIILHLTGAAKKAVLEQAVARAYPVAAVLTQDSVPVTTWWTP